MVGVLFPCFFLCFIVFAGSKTGVNRSSHLKDQRGKEETDSSCQGSDSFRRMQPIEKLVRWFIRLNNWHPVRQTHGMIDLNCAGLGLFGHLTGETSKAVLAVFIASPMAFKIRHFLSTIRSQQ